MAKKGEAVGRAIRTKRTAGETTATGEDAARAIPANDPGLAQRVGRARASKEAQQAARIEAAKAIAARKRKVEQAEGAGAADKTANDSADAVTAVVTPEPALSTPWKGAAEGVDPAWCPIHQVLIARHEKDGKA